MKRLSPLVLYALEAALVLTFFIQALRFAIGTFYSRVAGASYAGALDPSLIPLDANGVLSQATVRGEIIFLIWMLALPLLALILGRVPLMLVIAAAITAVGRVLMNLGGISPALASAIAVGGGLLYIALLVRHRMRALPFGFVIALGADQLFRAAGDTLDPTWAPEYFNIQLVLALVTALIALLALRRQQSYEAELAESGEASPDRGMLPFWGGVGLGGLLFIELALLALPNAIAGRAQTEYATFVPLTLVATLLPLLPWVRARAREFVAVFDQTLRGWVWLLVIALLVILGTRLSGIAAGAALVAAQFLVSMLWWWLARPLPDKARHATGLWVVIGVAVFALLMAGDYFTYEYAYVQDFGGNLAFLDRMIPPMLRGFRGLGLGVLLLAIFFAALPMTQTLRRIPWGDDARRGLIPLLLIVIAATAGAAYLARPRLISAVQNVETIRIGTYNIHTGANEFYYPDLQDIARTIQVSGADVVMLQEVEAGRLTSFGVDQALWLARRVGMDRRFYPTNEGLHGLAVLSKVPISLSDGTPLTSVDQQTGAMRVQITPAANTVVTLYNTWLAPLTARQGGEDLEIQEQDQARQFTELLAWVASQHPGGVLGRTVIGGTFHNVPDSPIAGQMRAAGFEDPFAGLPTELSATLWRSDLPHVRFDYLWLRNLGRLRAGVIDPDFSDASDHRMSVAEVSLGG